VGAEHARLEFLQGRYADDGDKNQARCAAEVTSQVAVRRRFAVEFDLELQLFVANTRAQFLVVIEAGTPAQQAAPAPVAVNLSDITWRATPLLAQRVILSGIKMKHHFGALIKRSLTNSVLSAERLLYTAWTAAPAGSEPATPTFVLRARLLQFDTENSVPGATGFLYAALSEAKASIS